MKKLHCTMLMIALLVLLGTTLLGATGCAGRAASPGASSGSAAAGQSSAEPPTIELVTPTDGATVPAGDVSMSVKTTGLKFVMPSNTNVAGEGHVHFTLDDQPFKMSVKPDYVYTGIAPGPHELKAELVQNDTKSFDPPVEQVISFTVE